MTKLNTCNPKEMPSHDHSIVLKCLGKEIQNLTDRKATKLPKGRVWAKIECMSCANEANMLVEHHPTLLEATC